MTLLQPNQLIHLVESKKAPKLTFDLQSIFKVNLAFQLANLSKVADLIKVECNKKQIIILFWLKHFVFKPGLIGLFNLSLLSNQIYLLIMFILNLLC